MRVARGGNLMAPMMTSAHAGSRDRGARRIVIGQCGGIYYTDDHYKSFGTVLR
ncbi:ribonuclease domain-containing protein [Streptomyces xylophagus]|uniref:ribonuclease domain-containing protein n=1 Tax=Streptomyces xylophagus TaxID=285514 RepID=UPI000D12BFB0